MGGGSLALLLKIFSFITFKLKDILHHNKPGLGSNALLVTPLPL